MLFFWTQNGLTFLSSSWKWEKITEEAKLNKAAFRKYILEVYLTYSKKNIYWGKYV